jgi:hypothetical protein
MLPTEPDAHDLAAHQRGASWVLILSQSDEHPEP